MCADVSWLLAGGGSWRKVYSDSTYIRCNRGILLACIIMYPVESSPLSQSRWLRQASVTPARQRHPHTANQAPKSTSLQARAFQNTIADRQTAFPTMSRQPSLSAPQIGRL